MKVDLFPSFMRKNAFAWYIQNTTQREREGKGDWDWKSLESSFLNSGGPIETRHEAIQYKLWHTKQKKEESCYAFAVRVDNLCKKDKKCINYIKRGLKPAVLTNLNLHNPETLSKLMELLKADESTMLAEQLAERHETDHNEIVLMQSSRPGKDRRPIYRTPQTEREVSSYTSNPGQSYFSPPRQYSEQTREYPYERNAYPKKQPDFQQYPRQDQSREKNDMSGTKQVSFMEPPGRYSPRPQRATCQQGPRRCFGCNEIGYIRYNCPLNYREGERGPPGRNLPHYQNTTSTYSNNH